MLNLKVILLVALAASSVVAINGKCRALVLSGGGDKGSYEAMAFKTWTELLSQEDMAYDVVTGVSAGTLNGGVISWFKPGDEKAAAEYVYNTWVNLKSTDAFTNWPGGILQGLFEEQGIFNEENLRVFFKKVVDGLKIEKRVGLGSVDMSTGTFHLYEYDPGHEIDDHLLDSVIASTAMPLAFPPIFRGNRTLLDGGVIWKMDVPGAIRRCLEIVDDESDIILDVIMTAQSFLSDPGQLDNYSTLSHLMRGMEIRQWHKNMKVLNNTLVAHPKVNFRYVLAPSQVLTISPLPLDLSQKHLQFWFGVAKKDAEAAVRLGEGGYMNLLLDYNERLMRGEPVRLDQMIETKLAQLPPLETHVEEREVLKSE